MENTPRLSKFNLTQLSCMLNVARKENNQVDIDRYSNEINKRREKKKQYNKNTKANLLAKNVNDTHLTYHIGNIEETINGNLIGNTENRSVSLNQAVKLLREYYGKKYSNNQEQSSSDSSSNESKPVSPAVETTPKRGHKIARPAPTKPTRNPEVCRTTIYETAGINSVDYFIRNNKLQSLSFNFQYPTNSDEQE